MQLPTSKVIRYLDDISGFAVVNEDKEMNGIGNTIIEKVSKTRLYKQK